MYDGEERFSRRTSSPSALSELLTSDIERIEVTKGGAASTLYGSDAANGVIQIFTKDGATGEPEVTFRTEQGGNFPVSATSVTEDDLAAASDAELTYWLYLLRQEVFFLEGRRLHDLGIRLPIMQREIDASRTISEGDLGTERLVPSYIPQNNEMDLYEPVIIYDGDELVEDEVTMLHDMNRILTDQRGLLIDAPFGS